MRVKEITLIRKQQIKAKIKVLTFYTNVEKRKAYKECCFKEYMETNHNKNNKNKMEKQINNKKISLFIGLNQNEKNALGRYKHISKRTALRVISRKFIKYGISGFSYASIKGAWLNTVESSLNITFFNTFDITRKQLNMVIKELKLDLKQDAILLEVLSVPFEFI